MTDRETADVLAEMRGAFDGNDVPRKNRALRWGWDALNRAEHQLSELRAENERDRSTVAEGVTALRKVLAGRQWLREPGRGSYAYDDDRWREEFGAALDEIEAAMEPLRLVAGNMSNCPTDWRDVTDARKSLTEVRAERDTLALQVAGLAWKEVTETDPPHDLLVGVYSPKEFPSLYLCTHPLPSTSDWPRYYRPFVAPEILSTPSDHSGDANGARVIGVDITPKGSING